MGIPMNNSNNPVIRYWIPNGSACFEAIKYDLVAIKNRGFSGIEIVFENFHDRGDVNNTSYGEKEFPTLIRSIIYFASELSLTVDLALGLQWPISSPKIMGSEDIAAAYQLNEVITSPIEVQSFLLNFQINQDDFVCASAYSMAGENLILESYIDLSSCFDFKSGVHDYQKIETLGRDVSIFIYFGTPTKEKAANTHYVIDHLNNEGAESAANYIIDLINSNEIPKGSINSIFCDSLEFHSEFEWTRCFDRIFRAIAGYEIYSYLPFIGYPQTYPKKKLRFIDNSKLELIHQVNKDYGKVLTHLYSKKHLMTLKRLFNEVGIKVRAQVAYNKPFSIEDSAMFVDIPENESLGRTSIDNLKTMSAARNFNDSGLYSYECSAEYMNSYGQSLKDLLWWVRRSWISGVNHHVLHGATYSGVTMTNGKINILGDYEWPGYEAFGRIVSNYWNRTLSSKATKSVLDYIGNINEIARNEKLVDFAVFRKAYINPGKGGDYDYLLKRYSGLNRKGYNFEFIGSYILQHVSTEKLSNFYQGIIVPKETELDLSDIEKLSQLSLTGFKVFIEDSKYINMGQFKSSAVYIVENNESLTEIIEKEVPAFLSNSSSTNISSICYSNKQYRYWFLDFSEHVKFDNIEGKFLSSTTYPHLNDLDLYSGETRYIQINDAQDVEIYDEIKREFKPINSYGIPSIPITKDSFIILRSSSCYKNIMIIDGLPSKYEIEKIDFEIAKYKLRELADLSDIGLDQFHIVAYEIGDFEAIEYTSSYNYQETFYDIYLRLPYVNDCVEIFINGKYINNLSCNNMRIEISSFMNVGFNEIKVVVFGNLYNYFEPKQRQIIGMIGNTYIEKKEKNYVFKN